MPPEGVSAALAGTTTAPTATATGTTCAARGCTGSWVYISGCDAGLPYTDRLGVVGTVEVGLFALVVHVFVVEIVIVIIQIVCIDDVVVRGRCDWHWWRLKAIAVTAAISSTSSVAAAACALFASSFGDRR